MWLQAGLVNGDGNNMEVDPPCMSLGSPSSLQPLPYPQDTHHTPPESFEPTTEQIKKILAFGKDLQALYDSLTAHAPNEKFKVLLQVILSVC